MSIVPNTCQNLAKTVLINTKFVNDNFCVLIRLQISRNMRVSAWNPTTVKKASPISEKCPINTALLSNVELEAPKIGTYIHFMLCSY